MGVVSRAQRGMADRIVNDEEELESCDEMGELKKRLDVLQEQV